MGMVRVRAANKGYAGTSDDQFLFEDRQSQEASESVFTADLIPKTDQGQKTMLGGLATMLAYKALDLIWDSWEQTPDGQNFGDSLNGYVPHFSVYVPIVLLTAFILIRVLTARRARGMALASLWVNGRTFMMVPSNRKTVSFNLAAERIGTVTVREKAFTGGKLGMAVEDATGNRHTIDELASAAELGPFAEYCRRVGIRFVTEQESWARQIVMGFVFAVIALLFICALDRTHPVQMIVKMGCAMLVGFLVPKMLGEKEE